MKKLILTLLFLGAVISGIFAQRLSSVGILPFEAKWGGNPADAANLTRQVIEELSSWGTLAIITDGEAERAEYVVRTELTKQGNVFILSATTSESRSRRVLNESKEQAPTVNGISIFSFCAKVVENVPYPNYLLGKWRSIINLPDSPVVCVMEFKSDRTVVVDQYDTWEHRQHNVLKYEGFGRGTYAYAGYLRRTMTIRDAQGNSRQIQVDATTSVNLNIEEALTDYTVVSQGGLRLLFDDAKNSFQIVSGGLPCGRNYDGPSVYPSERLFFTQFTKIQ